MGVLYLFMKLLWRNPIKCAPSKWCRWWVPLHRATSRIQSVDPADTVPTLSCLRHPWQHILHHSRQTT